MDTVLWHLTHPFAIIAVRLGPDAARWAWVGAGIALALVWCWAAYRILRRLLGHRRFRGTWYSAASYGQLMQVIWEDQQSGHRVLSHEERTALREFMYGRDLKPVIRNRGGGYFDV